MCFALTDAVFRVVVVLVVVVVVIVAVVVMDTAHIEHTRNIIPATLMHNSWRPFPSVANHSLDQ